MVDLIYIGWPYLLGTRTKNFKMKKSFPELDLNPGPSGSEANALSVELLELINPYHLNVTTFYQSFQCKLNVPRAHLFLPVLFLVILSCIFLI